MKKLAAIFTSSLLIIQFGQPSFSQTSGEINALIKKSKLVDTGRKVNSSVSSDKVTISTYCDPKSTDKDCKITALLMMKEIKTHFKNILSIKVLFFDAGSIERYREIEIRQGDVVQMDMGKSVDEVLAQISVAQKSRKRTQVQRTASSRQSFARQKRQNSQSTKGFYQSQDGRVSFKYSDEWLRVPATSTSELVRVVYVENGKQRGIFHIIRSPTSGLTLENIVEQYASGIKLLNLKVQKNQTLCGVPAIYLEASLNLGVSMKERATFLTKGGYSYIVKLHSSNTDQSAMDRAYKGFLGSVNIN